ncbi:MAG TPA: rhodanese-like domain-containing protein [Symbiobacteriaceae bacterium]|nr:rhodanese-like domain-containing protein [Symbiobacteriaceae bacterium]
MITIPALHAADFATALAAGAIPLDLRLPAHFVREHIAGAINVQFGKDNSAFFLPREQSYVIVTEPETAVPQLAAAGLDVQGFLEGGMKAWLAAGQAVAEIEAVMVSELQACLTAGHTVPVLDVREAHEFAAGHIAGAVSLPLGEIRRPAAALDLTRPWLVICSDEGRASTAVSLLRRLGCQQAALVLGGIAAWTAAGFPLERVA